MATRALSSPPRILPLYARTLAPLLPGASLLPFLGGRGSELPDLRLTLADLRVEPDDLAAYAHVCGFSLRDELPATYPHVLAFGLHLALMADRRFPFGAVGLVHIANRIVQHRPIELGETLQLSVATTPLQDHPRGRTFALASEVRIGDELVWEDLSTMLRRGGGAGSRETSTGPGGPTAPSHLEAAAEDTGAESGDSPTEAGAAREERAAPPPRSAIWQLPGDLGRRYGAVSGDRNPIHLHPLTAKLFGFPRAIAHGMWTKARCLAALEQLLPDSFSVEVNFRRPILLPSKVAFGSEDEDGAIRFAVQEAKGDTRHLDGRIEPLAGTPTHRETERGRQRQ
jgi:acyl dehydratase